MVLKEVGNVVQLSGLNLCIGALQSELQEEEGRKQKMKENLVFVHFQHPVVFIDGRPLWETQCGNLEFTVRSPLGTGERGCI